MRGGLRAVATLGTMAPPARADSLVKQSAQTTLASSFTRSPSTPAQGFTTGPHPAGDALTSRAGTPVKSPFAYQCLLEEGMPNTDVAAADLQTRDLTLRPAKNCTPATVPGCGNVTPAGDRQDCRHDEWRDVRNDGWEMGDATIACRPAGPSLEERPATTRSPFTTAGLNPFGLDSVACRGTERSLAECGQGGWGGARLFFDKPRDR